MAGILAQTFVLLLSAVCAVVGLALLFVIVYIWRKSRQYDHLPGPKPSSFILGNIPDLKRNYEKGVPFTETVYQWCLQYGDLFTYRLLHINVIVAVRPEAIKSVLVTEGFPKHEYFYRNVKWLCGARFLGDGLVSDVNHDTWTHQRAAMNPAFIRGSLKSLMGSFNAVGESFCDRLANMADGKTMLTILHELNRATLDAIGKVAYAVDIDSLNNDVNPYSSSIHKAFEGMRETFTNPLAMMNPFALWSLKRDVRSSCESLRNLAREVINKRKKAMKNDDYIPDDILTNIIKFEESQTDDADAMEVAIDNFVTFFVAGQETTANMLSFALLELGRKPDVLARLREEVEEVLGARRDVDYEDLSSLNYCDNVIKETLRMYPPAAVTFREVNRDGFTLEGYPIPKGSNLMASTYVCSRHPDLHPDPLEFRPERFDDEKTRPTPYTSFPFILGPRNCIGQNFARMESKVLLSKFVQRFDIHLDPTQSFGIEETTTMRPKDGTRATLTLREQTA